MTKYILGYHVSGYHITSVGILTNYYEKGDSLRSRYGSRTFAIGFKLRMLWIWSFGYGFG